MAGNKTVWTTTVRGRPTMRSMWTTILNDNVAQAFVDDRIAETVTGGIWYQLVINDRAAFTEFIADVI